MLLVLATLAMTAFFLAQGTTRLVAASALSVDRSFTLDESQAPPPRREQKSIDGICERNIFDSEQGQFCTAPVVETEDGECPEGQQRDDEGDCVPLQNGDPTPCEGSIRLVASVVHPANDAWSFAAIIGNAGTARLYRTGQSIDEKEVAFVGAKKVYLRAGPTGLCYIAMFGEEETAAPPRPPPPPQPAVASARRATREGAISNDDLEAGINRVSDTQFNIQRSLVDQILTNQAELMRTARIIPHEENGRVVGVKMYGIRRSSLLGRLGVQNGDMLRTINGYDMSSPDSALEAYARLREADHLTLSVVRRGQAMTIDYNIQ